jgi:hypothetical protein
MGLFLFWGQDIISNDHQGSECVGLFTVEYMLALWAFELQNITFMEITKHNHKIQNTDHEFRLTKI